MAHGGDMEDDKRGLIDDAALDLSPTLIDAWQVAGQANVANWSEVLDLLRALLAREDVGGPVRHELENAYRETAREFNPGHGDV
jgi:hypothetical protein